MKKSGIAAALLSLVMFSAPACGTSKEWAQTLDSRTALIWADAQTLGTMVLNARAKLFVTWLPRSIQRRLDSDRDVDDWVVSGFNFYSSVNEDVKARMKGRDVIALNYSTLKSWRFDPTELSVGDYDVADEDILGNQALRGPTGDLPSGVDGLVFICVPSLKPGSSVKISLGPDSAVLKLPKR